MRAWRAAWIIAQAFSPTPVKAVITFPAYLFSTLVTGSRYTMFSPEGTGVAQLAPYQPARSLVRAVTLVASAMLPALLCTLLLPVFSTLTFAILTLVVCLVSVGGMVWFGVGSLVASRGFSKSTPVGRETPAGKHVVVSSLAQMPGTRSSILFTLRSAIAALESGTAVVTTAATEELARRYERLSTLR